MPVCLSTTRWTSHRRACKVLYESYQAQIGVLAVYYNQRKEPKALSIFKAITSEIFNVSLFILYDVIPYSSNLILQTGNGQLCLRDVKTYIHLTKSKLENLRTGETKWFEEEHFDDMVCKAQSADTSFGWEHYVTDVFKKFLSIFIVQLDDAFEGLEF